MSLDVSTKNNSRRKNYIAHSVRALLGPPSKTCYNPYEQCYKPSEPCEPLSILLKKQVFLGPHVFLKTCYKPSKPLSILFNKN